MKIILPTGARSFMGSHLVGRLVEKKYEIIVLNNFIGGSLKNLK